MNSSNLKTLLTEYEKKRLQAIYSAEQRKIDLYKQEPKLQQIDDQLSKTAISISKQILLSKDSSLLEELNNKIDELKKEKESILYSLGKDDSYLKPKFECSDCNDTGYITNSYETTMCHCLKQKLFNLEYNKSNLSNLEKENFNNFSFDLYSNEINEEKYHSKLSPRKNIEFIVKLSHNFTVLYQTAPVMLDTIMDYRFGKENTSKDIYDNLLNVDLLIIDDLGTECINNMKFSELFNIINTRLLNNNKSTKTIISTNLSLERLFSTYDERIVSRLVGNYDICHFFGDDIRFMKK